MKLEIFCPEANVELEAKPIAKVAEIAQILRKNAEPIKIENAPNYFNLYSYNVPG